MFIYSSTKATKVSVMRTFFPFYFALFFCSVEKTGVLRYGSAAAAYSGGRSKPVSRV